MKVLKYLILALFLLNLPSISLVAVNASVGGILSYSSYGLLILYYILEKGGRPNLWFVILGLFFFVISGLNFYAGEVSEYFISFAKFLVVIFGGSVLVKKLTANELLFFLFVGSITIVLEPLLFPTNYGRYSGFYVNPNTAGFIAIAGYALTFRIKSFSKRTIIQILFTICGLVTFSRTFILLWILVNLISIRINIKNIRILGAGLGLLILLTVFGEVFKLNTIRLKQLTALVHHEDGAIKQANKGSRTETWAYYYDYILEKPIFGNGYNAFQAVGLPPSIGVHNSYMLIIGESGLFPLLIFIAFIVFINHQGFIYFRKAPYLLMLSLTFTFFMLTFHNIFAVDSILIIALWISYRYKAIAQREELEQDVLVTEENGKLIVQASSHGNITAVDD